MPARAQHHHQIQVSFHDSIISLSSIPTTYISFISWPSAWLDLTKIIIMSLLCFVFWWLPGLFLVYNSLFVFGFSTTVAGSLSTRYPCALIVLFDTVRNY